jgi:hypothetical protein
MASLYSLSFTENNCTFSAGYRLFSVVDSVRSAVPVHVLHHIRIHLMNETWHQICAKPILGIEHFSSRASSIARNTHWDAQNLDAGFKDRKG